MTWARGGGGINAVKGERKKLNFRFKIEGKLKQRLRFQYSRFQGKKYANTVLGQGPRFQCTNKYKPNIALKSCGASCNILGTSTHNFSKLKVTSRAFGGLSSRASYYVVLISDLVPTSNLLSGVDLGRV